MTLFVIILIIGLLLLYKEVRKGMSLKKLEIEDLSLFKLKNVWCSLSKREISEQLFFDVFFFENHMILVENRENPLSNQNELLSQNFILFFSKNEMQFNYKTFRNFGLVQIKNITKTKMYMEFDNTENSSFFSPYFNPKYKCSLHITLNETNQLPEKLLQNLKNK